MTTRLHERRTTRLPAIGRFRAARARMALESAGKRADAVARIAVEVTKVLVAAQDDLESDAKKRALAAARLRDALGRTRAKLSADVMRELEKLADRRVVECARRKDATATFQAKLRRDVEKILTSDFGVRA